jgi:hypothetical protein
MNILKMIALLVCVLGLGSTLVRAAEPSPEERVVAAAEAQAQAARQALAEKKAMDSAKKKAEWASKTHLEAWSIRGQSVVDASQYGVGQVSRGLCNADGYVGMAVAVPSAYLTAAAFSGAEASKTYAAKAWDNDVQVAVKPEAPKAPETK